MKLFPVRSKPLVTLCELRYWFDFVVCSDVLLLKSHFMSSED